MEREVEKGRIFMQKVRGMPCRHAAMEGMPLLPLLLLSALWRKEGDRRR